MIIIGLQNTIVFKIFRKVSGNKEGKQSANTLSL